MSKDCAAKDRKIRKLERQIRIYKMQISAYKEAKFPKTLVKKVVHKNLLGPGKFMSKAQLNWMLDSTEEQPRERSREWSLKDKQKVCYFIFFWIFLYHVCSVDLLG